MGEGVVTHPPFNLVHRNYQLTLATKLNPFVSM